MGAKAARDAGDLIVSGTLVDDAGEALPKESIALTIAREADPKQPLSLSDEGRSARACTTAPRDRKDARPTGLTSGAGGAVLLATDESGLFCVRLAGLAPHGGDKYVATLTWAGTELVTATKLELYVDTSRKAIALHFDPQPRTVSLDRPTFSLQVVASYEENQTTHAGANLPISVTNERGDALGDGATSSAGILRVSIPAERLGPPGRGELRVSFSGNDELTRSVHGAPIERRARVRLEVPMSSQKALSPEDGIPIAITARAKGGTPTGNVEARYGDAVVGAATLENGAATIVATFAALHTDSASPQAHEVELRLRYLPNAPWFEPAEDAVVRVPVRGPSVLRQAPLAIAGLAVIAWLVLGRLKRAPRSSSEAEAAKPAPAGEARIDLVRPSRDPRAGWSGRVVDAHEGTPVSKARLRIELPGFERTSVVASAFANEMGRFELRTTSGETGGELVVEGPLHAEVRQALPPCGELEVALVLRKRKVLDRLVAWAKRRGRPFDAQPEPTPAQVRRAAGNDLGTARWADAVEKAAYGGEEVDARLEAEVERLAPEGKPKEQELTVRDIPPHTTTQRLPIPRGDRRG